MFMYPVPLTESAIHESRRDMELPAEQLLDLSAAPPIDRDQLLKQCLCDSDFALSVLNEFSQSSSTRLQAFDVALSQNNHEAIYRLAHGLKGVAAALAFPNLIEICSNLQSTKSCVNWNQTVDLIHQLRREVERVIEFIPTIQALS